MDWTKRLILVSLMTKTWGYSCSAGIKVERFSIKYQTILYNSKLNLHMAAYSFIHTFIHYTHMIMLCCIKEYIVVLKNNLFGFSTIAYQGSRPIFLCEIIVEICFQSKLLFLLLSYFNFLINSRPILQCTLFVLARSWHSLYRPKYRPTFIFYVKLMLCWIKE